jgi:alkylation response protein AidB-like acyl-CoA dehydrogenase
MHFAFTDDQMLFRDTVRDILTNECSPEAVRDAWTNESGRVRGLWATLAATGVVGLTAPESAEGLGMNEVDFVMLAEETGRAACPEPIVEHIAVAVPLLVDAGGSFAERWLGPAARGEALLGVGFEAAGYVLAADQADLFLLERDGQVHGIDPGSVSMTRQRSVDDSRRLFSVDWQPSPDTLVTEDADVITRAFDRGCLATASQCVGVAQRLVDMTVSYVGEREQFGKPVGVNQAVKHHLSNAALGIEFARPMVSVGAYGLANDSIDASRDVSMAKALASDAVDEACRVALQCHGAIGYTIEYDLQLWLKRGWALAASWGDASWHRNRVGTAIGV